MKAGTIWIYENEKQIGTGFTLPYKEQPATKTINPETGLPAGEPAKFPREIDGVWYETHEEYMEAWLKKTSPTVPLVRGSLSVVFNPGPTPRWLNKKYFPFVQEHYTNEAHPNGVFDLRPFDRYNVPSVFPVIPPKPGALIGRTIDEIEPPEVESN